MYIRCYNQKNKAMEVTRNVIGWFEIPVSDMERAIRFYETVFEFKLIWNQIGPLDMAMFPWMEKFCNPKP